MGIIHETIWQPKQQQKSCKIRKIVKRVLFILPFLLNNLSVPKLSDSEEAEKKFVLW